MTKRINFDMDGTLADFYGVENWLDYLLNGQTKPYREARPMHNMRRLNRALNQLQANGWEINIVSWLSRGGSKEYGERITKAKENWLRRHMGSVIFDNIIIVDYGTEKYTLSDGILFDDEEHNRKEWEKINGNTAFSPEKIFEVLKELLDK